MHPTPPLPPWLQPGPVGRQRPTGRDFLLGILTVGIGLYVWTYRVHKEMKAHTGSGIGGGIAVVIMLAVSLAMPFLTSAEVAGLYRRRGLPAPLSGVTGLWVLVPALLGYVTALAAVFTLAYLSPDSSGVLLVLAAVVGYLALLLAGSWVWFRRTNEALNAYWRLAA